MIEKRECLSSLRRGSTIALDDGKYRILYPERYGRVVLAQRNISVVLVEVRRDGSKYREYLLKRKSPSAGRLRRVLRARGYSLKGKDTAFSYDGVLVRSDGLRRTYKSSLAHGMTISAPVSIGLSIAHI